MTYDDRPTRLEAERDAYEPPVADEEFAPREEPAIHTHLLKESKDCDSTYTNGWIRDGRLSFFDMPTTYGENGSYSSDFATSSVNDQFLLYRVEATTPTEEGYEHITMQECDDTTCDLNFTSHRDDTAERAGY